MTKIEALDIVSEGCCKAIEEITERPRRHCGNTGSIFGVVTKVDNELTLTQTTACRNCGRIVTSKFGFQNHVLTERVIINR